MALIEDPANAGFNRSEVWCTLWDPCVAQLSLGNLPSPTLGSHCRAPPGAAWPAAAPPSGACRGCSMKRALRHSQQATHLAQLDGWNPPSGACRDCSVEQCATQQAPSPGAAWQSSLTWRSLAELWATSSASRFSIFHLESRSSWAMRRLNSACRHGWHGQCISQRLVRSQNGPAVGLSCGRRQLSMS